MVSQEFHGLSADTASSAQVQQQLRNVTGLRATFWAFAALREDGRSAGELRMFHVEIEMFHINPYTLW